MSDPPRIDGSPDEFENPPDFMPVAPEFLALAVSEGCCVECEEDWKEVLDDVASVTAVADRLGLTAVQRLAAANFFRTRQAEFYRDEGDMWTRVINAIERVAATPWCRPVGTESHFARLDVATIDEEVGYHVETLVHTVPFGLARNLADRVRQHLIEERAHLRARLRECAWIEATAARSLAARRGHHRRPHTHRARRRGAGRPKASSSRSSSRSGDSPSDPSEPAPASRRALLDAKAVA